MERWLVRDRPVPRPRPRPRARSRDANEGRIPGFGRSVAPLTTSLGDGDCDGRGLEGKKLLFGLILVKTDGSGNVEALRSAAVTKVWA